MPVNSGLCEDMENKNTKQPNLIEMAKKRRHLHLVEKLATGRSSTPSLKPSEIKELEKFEIPKGSPTVVDSQEKIAKIFKVSVRTVRYWIQDGMPVTHQGEYDLLEIRAWRIVRSQRKSKKSGGKNIDWEDRYREYKARLAEIELKKALEEVVEKKQVEQELTRGLIMIKQLFLALPKQIAPQLYALSAREIDVLLTTRIKEIMNDFANGIVERSLKGGHHAV
jgi:phage terminase Nu1 subunit (DNA packaging protein)